MDFSQRYEPRFKAIVFGLFVGAPDPPYQRKRSKSLSAWGDPNLCVAAAPRRLLVELEYTYYSGHATMGELEGELLDVSFENIEELD